MDEEKSLFKIAAFHIFVGLCLFAMGCVWNDVCYSCLLKTFF